MHRALRLLIKQADVNVASPEFSCMMVGIFGIANLDDFEVYVGQIERINTAKFTYRSEHVPFSSLPTMEVVEGAVQAPALPARALVQDPRVRPFNPQRRSATPSAATRKQTPGRRSESQPSKRQRGNPEDREVDESLSDRSMPRFRVVSPSDPRLRCVFCGSAEVIEGKEGDHYPYCLRVPIECMLCGTVCLNQCKSWHEGTCPAKRARTVRIDTEKDFQFTIRRMQDKFVQEGNLMRLATHSVDHMHRPFSSLLIFLTDQMVSDKLIPEGLKVIYDQARNFPAPHLPMPTRAPPILASVLQQQRGTSSAIRASSRVRHKVRGKAERPSGNWRQATPSNARPLDESQLATWQRVEGGTDIHGEQKISDEEF